MSKNKFVLLSLSIFLFASVRSASAASTPSVSVTDLPSLVNWSSFTISYSALAPAGLSSVTLEYHKEGDAWSTLNTYTTNTGEFTVNSSQITQDNTYYFRATACDTSSNCSSDTTQTTIDRVAPDKPMNVSVDRIDDNTYRLRWTNPNTDDLYRVLVFRADHIDFTADSGTQIAAVDVTKNTNTQWNNDVPLDGKNYYYLIRSVDKAGNASDVMGDLQTIYTTTTETSSETTGTPVTGNESFSGKQIIYTAPAVLGEATEATPSTSPTPAEQKSDNSVSTKVESIVNTVKGTSPLWPIVGFIAFGLAVYWFITNNKPKASPKTTKPKKK